MPRYSPRERIGIFLAIAAGLLAVAYIAANVLIPPANAPIDLSDSRFNFPTHIPQTQAATSTRPRWGSAATKPVPSSKTPATTAAPK